MDFTSVKFLFLYLPLFLIIYYVIPCKFKNSAILIFSLLLIFEIDHIKAAILLFSICLNFYFGRLINKKGQVWVLGLGIFLNIALLSVFKYHLLLLDILHGVANIISSHKPQLHILSSMVLPIGISFYTFRAISYLVDVYRKKTEPEQNFIDFATYLSFFPLMIAGPIVRYIEMKSELHAGKPSFQQIAHGTERFIFGLARKVLIANTLGVVADKIFSEPVDDLSTPVAWLGLVSYTMQIFFDFAGYTDMAIGIGMILGFTFPENFNYPYISRNIREFWRRWHMSLSTWLRDYIFLPVAYYLSKKWKKDVYAGIRTDNLLYTVATMITFTICGFWHGSSLSFVIWGIYYALFMILEQVFIKRTLHKLWSPIQHLYTIIVIMGGWVLFRTADLYQAGHFYHKLFVYSAGSVSLTSYLSFFIINKETFLILICAIILSTPLTSILNAKLKALSLNSKGIWLTCKLLRLSFMFFLFLITLSYVVAQTYNPFIYSRF
ncbi:MAG: MBOAT family protein [Bacteroidetes bacterium]|nr:MBOAT family protein [Bacteroidota bacterium]